jgi:ABC-type transport system involved in multi-copper enzyme maturation permease subunit
MGLAKSVSDDIQTWGVMALVIVVILIVLAKFKTIDNSTTASNSAVDAFVTGLSEPKNWVAIVIIAVIGFGIIKYMKEKK